MIKKYKVSILGYGEMGHAMQHLLKSEHELSIWDKFSQPGLEPTVLENIIPDADFILFCLPVNPHKEILLRIAPMLKHNSICISIAKGLDEAGQCAAQIFQQVLSDKNHFVMLYGPMISEEIRMDHHAFAQIGSQNEGVCDMTHELFRQTRLHLQATRNIMGISWSVILKNVYALLFGMADELQLGDNMRGFLTVEAIEELNKIVQSKGGDPGSPYHLAGLGDLITTATSENSHHHSLGRRLARGDRSQVDGEGVHTLEMVEKHQLFKKEDFPLFALVHEIVDKPVDVQKKILEYINNKYAFNR